MPSTYPVSDLQRRYASMVAEANETLEPIYLTKNGHPSAVLMDAGAFERQMDFQQRVFDAEMQDKFGITEGIEQIRRGDFITHSDLMKALGEKWSR